MHVFVSTRQRLIHFSLVLKHLLVFLRSITSTNTANILLFSRSSEASLSDIEYTILLSGTCKPLSNIKGEMMVSPRLHMVSNYEILIHHRVTL